MKTEVSPRRVAMGESCATSINQNRNVLMQELDRFDGVVIVTTNLFRNYGPALLRRINRHIEFKLPNQAMRRKLIEQHLPNLQRVFADLDVLAVETKGFSGGACHASVGRGPPRTRRASCLRS